MASDCCTKTCVCRLGYPENRLVKDDEIKRGLGYSEKPLARDILAALHWSREYKHECEWAGFIPCIKYHYPGGWPAFIKEVVEKQ